MQRLLWALLLLAAGCGGASTGAPTASPPDATSRTEVQARLEDKLEVDPNRALCERIASLLAGGDRDALQPVFEHAGYVERIIERGGVPPAVQSDLRSRPTEFDEFGRIHFPDGSRFLCLGTRQLFGEDVIALRQWIPSRFDYILLHVGSSPDRPIDDYMVASGGHYTSEADALYFAPSMRRPMEVVSGFLRLSYESRFAEIIAQFQALPPALQESPVAFLHFINAVFTQERTGSPLYRETIRRMERVLEDRPYSLAYWRLIDARRRGDGVAAHHSRDTLLQLLDDYELLDP